MTEDSDSEDMQSGIPDMGESLGDEPPTDDYDLTDLGNVKQEWKSVTIYLPEELHDALELTYREVSYDCKRTSNYDLQKLQDFYPLLAAVGLNSLNQSDSDDTLAMLEYIQDEYE